MKSDSPRRRLFLDQVFNGSRHVVDIADTDFGAVNGLRTALYREATKRDLHIKVQQAPDGRIVVQAYGGSFGTYAPDFSDVDTSQATLTQDPTVGVKAPRPAPRRLEPATDLPPIAPGDELFVNPGAFWEGRTWVPASVWVNPFGPGHPNPLQCTWYPYKELWELQDLSDLETRRREGTLMPHELRQGFVPPGTEFSRLDVGTFEDGTVVKSLQVWNEDDWWELACERHYCTCDMRLDGTLVNPNRLRPDHPLDCGYWEAPEGIDDQETLAPMLDPRALRAPEMIARAEVLLLEQELAREARAKAGGPR